MPSSKILSCSEFDNRLVMWYSFKQEKAIVMLSFGHKVGEVTLDGSLAVFALSKPFA